MDDIQTVLIGLKTKKTTKNPIYKKKITNTYNML